MKEAKSQIFSYVYKFGITIIIAVLSSCNSTAYRLDQLQHRLGTIKTISYTSESKISRSGNNLINVVNQTFVKMYSNPDDPYLGVSFSYSNGKDLNIVDGCYDGKNIVIIDWKNKEAEVIAISDVVKDRIRAPFFVKAKLLVEYALNNPDNSKITIENFKDSTRIIFIFKDKIVEYFGKYPLITTAPGKTSKYDLLINNKTKLPYKLTCDLANNKFSEECRNVQISRRKELFEAMRQIPMNFSVVQNKVENDFKLPNLEHKLFNAPDWILKEVDGDSVSFKDLKSKVILIELTGIPCGPCKEALPFLKKLVNLYKNNDFEFLSIETSTNSLKETLKYKKKNSMNYRYLIGYDDIFKDYKTPGIPSFVIIDENRKIRKVILGYYKGKTETQILNSINELL